MTGDSQERWQLSGSEPEFYELYLVPRLLLPTALRLLEGVPLRTGQAVLDVACGTGIAARLAAERIGPSGHVVAIDLNEDMLAVARRRAADAGLRIDWKQADATSLPFPDGTFDVVLCQQALQFLPDKRAALREMHRVMVPGGMLALSVFGRASRFNTALADALAKHVDAKTARRSLAPFALSDPAALRAIICQAPFSKVDIRNFVLMRRVEPTQRWLLEYTAGLPYSRAVAALKPEIRAQILQEIAAQLREFWDVESFAVPSEVQLVYALK